MRRTGPNIGFVSGGHCVGPILTNHSSQMSQVLFQFVGRRSTETKQDGESVYPKK